MSHELNHQLTPAVQQCTSGGASDFNQVEGADLPKREIPNVVPLKSARELYLESFPVTIAQFRGVET